MRVELNLPDRAFWRLAAEAEHYGMSTAELIADLTLASIRKIPQGGVDPVVVRWNRGWTDKAIGDDLDLTIAQVKRRREKYGLRANSVRAETQRRLLDGRAA